MPSCFCGPSTSELALREQHLREQVQTKDAQLQTKVKQLEYLQRTFDSEIRQKDQEITQLLDSLRLKGVPIPAPASTSEHPRSSSSSAAPREWTEAEPDDDFHDCFDFNDSLNVDDVSHAHAPVILANSSAGPLLQKNKNQNQPPSSTKQIKNPNFNWSAGYVGHLSQSQTDAVEQLRSLIRDSTAGDAEERKLAEDDRGLLRFLRARDFDVTKACKMASATMEWRKKWKPRNITFDLMPTATASGVWRFAGHTKTGLPIILARTWLWRPRDYYGTAEFVNYVAWFLETELTMRTVPSDSSRDECDIQRIFVIFDLKGFSLYHHNDIRMHMVLISVLQSMYPETLGVAVAVNAPWVFQGVWAVLKPLLDPETARRCHILGKDASKVLLEHIEVENLPRDLGGTKDEEYPIPTGPLTELDLALYLQQYINTDVDADTRVLT